MITAKQAHENYKNNKPSEDEEREFDNLIEKASISGERHVFYYREIKSNMLKTLKGNGFRVETHSDQREGILYKIMW